MVDISVVIPSYNSEEYIEETLRSVLGQTISSIEVIVVDDGSTDRTAEIVRSFAPHVKLIQQPNAGVSVARNRGIREAKGNYISFIDSDDCWFPDKLEKQRKAFDEHPDVGVVFSAFLRWEESESHAFQPATDFYSRSYKTGIDPIFSGWIYHQFLLDCWMLTSSAMIRREALHKCGVFNTTLPCGEDWDLWLRLSREYKFIKLQEPTTLYRQHKTQTTSRVRDIDYRTYVLLDAVKKWGLSSPDGGCISEREFLSNLARYHAAFARVTQAAEKSI